MSDTHTHQALDTIQKGLTKTRENLYHWLEATPEEKQEIQLGSEDCCVEEHLKVIDESLPGLLQIVAEPTRLALRRRWKGQGPKTRLTRLDAISG